MKLRDVDFQPTFGVARAIVQKAIVQKELAMRAIRVRNCAHTIFCSTSSLVGTLRMYAFKS